MGGFEPFWHEYTFDNATGNRTALVKRSSLNTVTTASYSYPAAGAERPHAVSEVTGPASVSPGSYSYDEAGNMTGRPGQAITFNEVGKVSKVVSGSVTQDLVYNVDGSILLRTDSVEGATLFVGDTVLSQAVGSSVVAGVRTYSGAEGKPVAEKSAKTGTAGTTLTWVFSNLEGTVDVQTVANAAGVTTRTIRDPFGAPLGSSGVWGSGTGYMNKPATASTGLTTVGARTYDPVLGKFLSVDPVIDPNLPQQNTGYAYSGNNPTTYKDPSGLAFKVDCGCGGRTHPYAAPPRYKNSKEFGTQLMNIAKGIRNSSSESDEGARSRAYVFSNMGSFFKSEQGALIRAWMGGNLPQHIVFGEDSKITQGLRDHVHMRNYRDDVLEALRTGQRIPDPRRYDADPPSVSNSNFRQDLETLGNYAGATNTQRSLLVTGSYSVLAPDVTLTSATSATVTYKLRNDITVGSLVSLTDQLRQFGNGVPGERGPMSTVYTTFTWTEEVSW
ncbi:RHS repeat-associated core domain-containing protein [Microbacterium sp. ZOR0019]|uniref:RHS repeat-associated core domain-containing protein n=1 Tax=Microbacterium sp. ZOR0019 TaxID=1339233 RepID=UPI0006461221|nr:RHS repeat-associated core domain-containing protein [Microbacterium sp. ZOR0019]